VTSGSFFEILKIFFGNLHFTVYHRFFLGLPPLLLIPVPGCKKIASRKSLFDLRLAEMNTRKFSSY